MVDLGPVVLDVAAYELSQEEKEVLQHPYVGGVIFFARNFESPEQIILLVRQIRSIRRNILIAVDQEGGRVQRFKAGFTKLPSLQQLAATHLTPQSNIAFPNIIKDAAWLMASELLSVGVDISFAPVVDADDQFSQVIGDRSFSKSVELVSSLGSLYIEGMQEAGMAATLKHFPGHGAVQADSHKALPMDERTFDDVWQSDMLPFRNLLPLAAGVMPAHILFNSIDDQPVGFSKYWLQEVLRGQLQYKGIIFSDDLSMEGAAIAGDHKDRALAALSAGCDAALVCNNPQKAIDVLELLQQQKWPITNRLASMRAKGASSLKELQLSLRWQQVVESINQIS